MKSMIFKIPGPADGSGACFYGMDLSPQTGRDYRDAPLLHRGIPVYRRPFNGSAAGLAAIFTVTVTGT